MRERGFTLTEVLIALGLSLLMFVAAFEFLGITRDLFGKLKNAEEDNQAAVAALDKIRIDLAQAGRGLTSPMRNSSIAGVEAVGKSLVLCLAERVYALTQDVVAGQTLVPLQTVSGLSPQREVCLAGDGWSELHTVSSCGAGAVILGEPLQASFSKVNGQLLLIERITYFLDEPSGIIRRQVNAGSPQPLLEGVAASDLSYDTSANLAKAAFSLQSSKEKRYEISVFPKNIGLVLLAH